MLTNRQQFYTILLLCFGYLIDFYDLTIMGVSYSELIQEQFKIVTQAQIQQTYLLISNCQTLGIFIGAIGFGFLGDRIGRARAIKLSILLYSLATLSAVFIKYLPLFLLMRTLAYAGLATEFATSTILLIEILNTNRSALATAILYSAGVLGGIAAVLIGFFSWRILFISGGVAGLILFIARAKLNESTSYLDARANQAATNFGNWRHLFTKHKLLSKLIKHFLLICPYFALITMMFIFPNYIIKNYSLGSATRWLLFGFFIGNIISSLLSAWYIRLGYSLYKYMLMNLTIYVILIGVFNFISENHLISYSIGLGLIGGGYPVIWTQMAARDFPLEIRSLANGVLTALGRGSGIGFNLLISSWLSTPQLFINNAKITSSLVALAALIALSTLSIYQATKPKIV